MFWRSVVSGFEVLLSWQVWAASLLYGQTSELCSSCLAVSEENNGTGDPSARRFLWSVLGDLLVRALLGGVLIVWLFPVMLGGSSAAPAGLMLRWAGSILSSSALAFALVGLLFFVPLAEEFVRRPRFSTLILDVLLFRALSGRVLAAWAAQVGVSLSGGPGFWACMGYLVVSLATVKAALHVVTCGLKALGVLDRDVGPLAASAIAALEPTCNFLASLLPIFIYVRHGLAA